MRRPRDINHIIDKYGTRIVYVKQTEVDCPNSATWNNAVHRGYNGVICSTCLGTGKRIVIEARIARHSSERVEIISGAGIPKRIDHTWYFKSNMQPKSGDIIVDCRWNTLVDRHIMKPIGINNIYRIDDIDYYTKERGNRLVYSRAYSTKITTFSQGPILEVSWDDELPIYLRVIQENMFVIE